MDRDEAFRILDLPPDADAQQARRAYLRRVKEHKPDEDPEGFRRVREAYELISAAPDEPVVVPGPSVLVEAAPVPVEGTPEPIEDEDELETEWTPEEGVPSEPALPVVLDKETIERLGREGKSEYLLLKSLEIVQRAEGGIDLVPEMVRVALESTPLPDSAATMALRVFFALQAVGVLDLSQQVFESVEEHPDIFGDTNDVETFHVHFMWAEELAALSKSFPQGLRRAIARGVLTDDMAVASDTMHRYAMDMPHLAVQAAELLQATPKLFELYHHILSGPRSETYSKRPLLGGGLGFAVLWILLQLIRNCDANSYRSYPSIPDSTSFHATIQREEAVSEARAVLNAHCRGQLREPKEPICILGFDYIDAANARSCAEAQDKRIALQTLNQSYPGKPRFDEVAFAVLWKAYDAACDPRYVAVDPESR